MSFETSWGVPPPAPDHPGPSAKRKRPSAASADVDGPRINLDKLMGLMEHEAKQPKPPSARDIKRDKAKKDRAAPAAAAAADGGPQAAPPPPAKRQRQDRPAPPHQQQQAKKDQPPAQPKEPRADGKAEKGKGRGKNKAARKANQEAAAAAAAAAAAGAGASAVDRPPHLDMDVDAASTPAAAAPPTIALKPETSVTATADSPVKANSGEPKKSKKALKKERQAANAAAASSSSAPARAASSPAKASKADKKNTVVVLDDEPAVAPKAVAPADSALTPMQLKMKRKLEGSRFRFINEQLYTTSSEEALDMMRKDPSVFNDYHVGFRSQTEGWPTSPVEILTTSLSALPQSALIIDLGCGDAALAQALVPRGLKVLSYDLVASDWVAECDYCERIPLPGKEGVEADSPQDSRIVDAAVCCLSLMGRNWMDGVREIARVLKEGGRFEIAEVQSRMSSIDAFVGMVSSLGFALAAKDASNTHFVLLSFVREGAATWAEGGRTWEDVLRQGEEVLKACVYKKR